MDKSFEGLLLSIFIHILLLVFLWNAKFPAIPVKDTTEITIIDKKPNGKVKRPISIQDKKMETKDLKVDTDFLSTFTNRVKKQLQASRKDKTVNAAQKPTPNFQPSPPQDQSGNPRNEEAGDESVGVPGGQRGQPLRNVLVGESALSEMVPGIQEGAFTALNSNASIYAVFFNRMGEQVRYRWVSSLRAFMAGLSQKDMANLAAMERVTVFEIILDPEGRVIGSHLQQSCGVSKLDYIDIDAFKQAGPFPNPPRGMIEPDGNIHLQFGFDLSFRPPTFGAG